MIRTTTASVMEFETRVNETFRVVDSFGSVFRELSFRVLKCTKFEKAMRGVNVYRSPTTACELETHVGHGRCWG